MTVKTWFEKERERKEQEEAEKWESMMKAIVEAAYSISGQKAIDEAVAEEREAAIAHLRRPSVFGWWERMAGKGHDYARGYRDALTDVASDLEDGNHRG